MNIVWSSFGFFLRTLAMRSSLEIFRLSCIRFETIIASLIAGKTNFGLRVKNGFINKSQRQGVWRKYKDWVGAKCQLFIENAPASVFYSADRVLMLRQKGSRKQQDGVFATLFDEQSCCEEEASLG
jgi:hypothetical protein